MFPFEENLVDKFIIIRNKQGTFSEIIAFIYAFPIHEIQVEVQIETWKGSHEENILDHFTIEAALFDTARWHSSNDHADLLSSSVANLELHSSYSPCIGFMGYLLMGRVLMPRLWSAEQVKISCFSP